MNVVLIGWLQKPRYSRSGGGVSCPVQLSCRLDAKWKLAVPHTEEMEIRMFAISNNDFPICLDARVVAHSLVVTCIL